MSSDAWTRRLLDLGHAVQRAVRLTTGARDEHQALPVAHQGGDTVFALDRNVEPALIEQIDTWPSECLPLLLIAEGMGEDGRRLFGDPGLPPRYRLIVDPIDGTRSLMYDKRSAWFIAAVAKNHGEHTTLADALAAVLVELPTTKQRWCDAFAATRTAGTAGWRRDLQDGKVEPLAIRPSQARDLRFGFGQVSNFFPGTKALAADLSERIVVETLGPWRPGEAVVFEDQYISSGGQMVELMMGRDRFTCDLRPLFYRILSSRGSEVIRGLECHPYDVAGALVAQNAGAVITDGFGRPLAPELNVHSGVHWCGFANETLARQIQPVILRWLHEQGIDPD